MSPQVPEAAPARPARDRDHRDVAGLRGDLRGTVEEPVLGSMNGKSRRAREITELLLDLVSSYGGGTAGPMTAAVLVSRIAR